MSSKLPSLDTSCCSKKPLLAANGSFDELTGECKLTVDAVHDSLARCLLDGAAGSSEQHRQLLEAMRAAVLADLANYLGDDGPEGGAAIKGGCARLDAANSSLLPDDHAAWRPPLALPGVDRPQAVLRDAAYADMLLHRERLLSMGDQLLRECRSARASLRAGLAEAEEIAVELEARARVLGCLSLPFEDSGASKNI